MQGLETDDYAILVDAIDEGNCPVLPKTTTLRPDPEHTAELRTVGGPPQDPGWATLAWPQLQRIVGITSGPFAYAIPKIKSYLPSCAIFSLVYATSGCTIAFDWDPFLKFAKNRGYVPNLLEPNSEEDEDEGTDEAVEKLVAKGWKKLEKSQAPDPDFITFCYVQLEKEHGITIQSVWNVGPQAMIKIWIFSFCSNYMPKEKRNLPQPFEFLDEGVKPVWYYHVRGRFWVKATVCQL